MDKLTAAVALIRQGQCAQAAQAIEALPGGGEKGVDADAVLYFLGLAEAGCGRAAEAMKHWDAIQAAGPMRDAAAIEAARQLLAAERWPEAVARLKPLLERQGGDPNATVQYWRGITLANLGRQDEAKKAWQDGAGRMRFRGRRGFYGPESGLSAVHAVMILRKLDQNAQADDLARQVQDGARRLEDMDPPQGRALAAVVNGLLAAAGGRAEQAAGLFDQAQGVPGTASGYLRLARTWADLLKRFPAKDPQSRPAAIRNPGQPTK